MGAMDSDFGLGRLMPSLLRLRTFCWRSDRLGEYLSHAVCCVCRNANEDVEGLIIPGVCLL